MEREIVFFAEGAEFVDPSWVSGGVKFGGDDDHGFFGERFAEGAELAGDDFEGFDWIGVGGVACVDEMNEEARALDVLQETNAEASALVGSFDEAGKIGNDESAAGLEATLGTLRLAFEDARLVAWCGGAFSVRIGGENLPARLPVPYRRFPRAPD